MLLDVETRQAIQAWTAITMAGKNNVKMDDLQKQGIPMLDDMLAVWPEVMKRIAAERRRRIAAAAKAAAGEE